MLLQLLLICKSNVEKPAVSTANIVSYHKPSIAGRICERIYVFFTPKRQKSAVFLKIMRIQAVFVTESQNICLYRDIIQIKKETNILMNLEGDV